MRHGASEGKDMNRRRRIFFNALTLESLVLCVAAVRFWVRSYRTDDTIGFLQRDGWSFMAEPFRGEIFWVSRFDSHGCTASVRQPYRQGSSDFIGCRKLKAAAPGTLVPSGRLLSNGRQWI